MVENSEDIQIKIMLYVNLGSYSSDDYSLWIAAQNSFEEALVLAVNLGEDTDTIGAICGQLAGAYYGVDAIPSRWLEQLHRIEDIKALAERLIK
jgi:ADP-ribosyl-[dinitrogen reductase] hydrolase